ncbi:MAG: AMP-binding protein, partial [Acidobacteria bacterium]|nr:AMP-binding protein [Acidobacteriota bacterium]
LEREVKKYLRWERTVHPVRFLNLLPLSHVFGQFMGIFVPQLLGGEVHFQSSLNPSEIAETVRRERVSVVVTVPRVLEALRERVERAQAARGGGEKFRRALAAAGKWGVARRWWAFRKVRREFGWKFWAFVAGGATLRGETEDFWQRLGYAVVQGYGMTETASLISVNHPFKRSRGSIGKTLPGQEVRLDESGEIMVRGANVSRGYWAGGARAVDDGWLRTGDLGELDAAGNLFFKGRKKDVIVTAAGVNIHPADLEAALGAQREVSEGVVVGLDLGRGPEPVAALILREEFARGDAASAAAAAAVGRANESLNGSQQIRRWVVWPERDFPRTATQKVRKVLVADALGAQLAGRAGRGGETPAALAEAIARVSRPAHTRGAAGGDTGNSAGAGLDRAATLETDLKLDSLGRVELLSALEDRYGVELDESAFTAATTVGDIERMIRDGACGVAAVEAGNEFTAGAAAECPYPRWARRAPVVWVRRALLYVVVLPLVWWMARPRVRGAGHLKNLKGPVLFVADHVTRADQALVLWALPRRFRHRLTIAMEGELLRDWRRAPAGAGLFARALGLAQYALVVTFFNVFPLPKRSGFRRSFAYAGESADRGLSLLVFPEGRRTNDGRMGKFMAGTGLLAADLNLPVVPVKLDGLFRLKREARYFARPGELTIRIGGPVVYGRDTPAAEIAADLERRVAELGSN